MKTRNDFVSNSSSCSFVISLQTDQDIAEFKKILPKVLPYTGNIGVFFEWPSYDAIDYIKSKDDKISTGSYLRLDVGEDHDMETIDCYRELEYLVTENDYKFKIYQDPDAHLTCGDDI